METWCNVCGGRASGKLFIRDPNIVEAVSVCGDCLNLWANHDFDKLTERLKGNRELSKHFAHPRKIHIKNDC